MTKKEKAVSEQLQWSIALKMAGMAVNVLYLATMCDISSDASLFLSWKYVKMLLLHSVYSK